MILTFSQNIEMSVNFIRASLQICHPAEICVTTLHYIAAEIYDDSTEMCVRLLSGGQWLILLYGGTRWLHYMCVRLLSGAQYSLVTSGRC